jgi:hypothetical protein
VTKPLVPITITPMPKTTSLLLTILTLLALPLSAQAEIVNGHGFAFDVPDGTVFRAYPSSPGGSFIPMAHLENTHYFAVMRLQLAWDQWPELPTEQFAKNWAVSACAADGASSSQWCEEGSVSVVPFLTSGGEKGYQMKRQRTVEFYTEDSTRKEVFTDLIVAFDIKGRSDGKSRLAAFVCEDESCFELMIDVGRSFR